MDKKVTVKDAVLIAFNEMEEKFPIIKLNDRVRYLRKQYYLQDDTIKRRLRELREDRAINFQVIDHVKCIYKKMKI